MISMRFSEPYSYIITLSILQVFLIPSAFCYLKMAKKNVQDIQQVKIEIKERTG
jgi:MFS transporter, Spinster family, sphingosine-1-phosphate transporter